MKNLELVVEAAALALVRLHDLDEVEVALRNVGVPGDLVAKLVLLVPSAFAAAYFGAEGIEFPTHFLIGPQDALRALPYATEPGYNEAQALAHC